MSEATEEQWHVQIEEGDVRLWTLDQLDAAFKADLVDESTFVLEVGKTEWMQLGTLLGGDDDEEAAASEAPPASSYAAAAAAAAVPAAAVASVGPILFAEPPVSRGPYSTAPVAADIDDDFDAPAPFRRSSKKPVVIGIGAVALLAAGVAVFASRASFTASSEPAPEAPVAAAAAAPPVVPAVAPVAAPTTDPQPAATSLSARLTQDQLQKLADQDKVRDAKLSAQQKARAAAAPHHATGHKLKEKGPFHSGGDKYDPLNAKL